MQRTWAEAQAAFAAAVIDPRLAPPVEVIECRGPGRRRGFAVYRNNSLVTLTNALQERFPVTCRLVGDEFFRAMARSYASGHRPRSPLLISYGDDFPAFIHAFRPADEVPYLSDVARLEAGWSEAYHAPEASPLEPQVLADTPPEALTEMRLTLHPSTRTLRSQHPVADIWAAHQSSGPVTPPTCWDPQDVLIVRSAAEVQVSTLSAGLYAFISALSDRRCVQDAAELALLENSEFDVGQGILTLLDIGVVVALGTAHTQEMQA